MMLCSDDETGQCVSTGNDDDIHKAENKVLFDFLDDGGFLPSGIQLPAGLWPLISLIYANRMQM